jgi:hypothetical protein
VKLVFGGLQVPSSTLAWKLKFGESGFAYWCVADENVPEQSGFLFGGLYTTAVSNPITQSKTCPLYFYQENSVNIISNNLKFKNNLQFIFITMVIFNKYH